MKYLKIYLFLFSFTILYGLDAQTVFFDNFDSETCNNNIPSFDCIIVNAIDDNNCLPGWSASQGTPNTVSNASPLPSPFTTPSISGSAIAMFRCPIFGQGEGVFTRFKFRTGFCYKLTFDLHSPNNNEGSVLHVLAATGLTQAPVTSDCCTGIPTPPFQESIQDVPLPPLPDAGFGSVSIFYQPSENFDQLWFFPNVNHVIMDNVRIELFCTPRIDYDHPDLDINTGITKAEIITTSTTGSLAGFVENFPVAQTEFVASKYIHIQPNTHLDAAGSGFFWAHIAPCDDDAPPEACVRGGDGDSDGGGRRDESVFADPLSGPAAELVLYPNPAAYEVAIQLPPSVYGNHAAAKVSLYDSSGRMVLEQTIPQGLERLNLDLSRFENGLYFIKVQSGSVGTLMKKLVISR